MLTKTITTSANSYALGGNVGSAELSTFEGYDQSIINRAVRIYVDKVYYQNEGHYLGVGGVFNITDTTYLVTVNGQMTAPYTIHIIVEYLKNA